MFCFRDTRPGEVLELESLPPRVAVLNVLLPCTVLGGAPGGAAPGTPTKRSDGRCRCRRGGALSSELLLLSAQS